MRLLRSWSIVVRLLLPAFAAGAVYGQTLVSLGASAGSSSGCSLTGGGTCSLSARVTGIANTSVSFQFSPAVAGAVIGPKVGPDSTGLTTITYTAPNPVASRQTVTVTATAADGTRAQTQITLTPPTVTVQVSPGTASLNGGDTQQFKATVLGISQTAVSWSISPLVGSIDGAGFYAAPASVGTTQKITVTAASVFDPTSTGTATITLNAVAITLSPATASLTNGQTQTFTATVTGGSNTSVTWSISPAVGTIDNNGNYIAPAVISSTQKVTVTATSVADTTKTATATVTLSQAIGPGSGAPTALLGDQFFQAYNRNGFNQLVSLPPLGTVKALGSAGYVQEFPDANKTSGVKYALATISPAAPNASALPVVQLYPDLYAFYASTGAGSAGYPLGDTLSCPAFDPANSCTYDLFDKGVALFAYANPLANGQNFSITGTFYTEWSSQGGIAGAGRPVSGQTAITAAIVAPATAGTTATVQTFGSGAIYSITSGVNRNKIFSVIEPAYDLYVSQSGPSGTLGLPSSEAIQIANGVYRQTFEGGALQYTSTSGPVVVAPVTQVVITGAASGSSTTMTLGQSITLTATPYSSGGVALTDRPITWTSTNGKVLSIQPAGVTAVVTATAGGSASVQAVSQGVASVKVNFIVTAPCCQVGDGAPATVQQTFQDALTRNRIAVQLPVQAPAARVANGWVQRVQSTDATPVTYLLTQSDQLGTAYVVTGGLLARYQALGGAAGPLGYPSSDASAGGTQLFSGGNALAGNPVRLVSGGVLAKWAQLGYESGAAGLPSGDAAAFSTPGANSGQQQTFVKGNIYAATAGPRSGQAWFVTGLILVRYNALGGAAGDLGMPASDEFTNGAVRQQNFENGNITYAPGDSAAVEHLAPRTPGIVVSPASVSAGGRVRLAAAGFANNSTLRVSVTGEPDFVVTTANGAYTWDMSIPLAAKSGTMSIRAVDTKGTDAASGTVAIKGFADNKLPIAKLQGDNQTGVPGALLPVPLRIALVDASGTPVAGAAITFQGSAGVQLSTSSAVTDSAGTAQTLVRLPGAEGVAAVTASAPAQAQAPVTFFAMAQRSTLANFPNAVQSGDAPLGNGTATIGQKGALLSAVAAIFRYHQNRGELPSPNGPADTAALNSYLKGYCTVDLKGVQVCDGFLSNPDSGEQIVNLWRAAGFTGGVDVRVQPVATSAIADLVAVGAPVLVSLALARNGVQAGGHFVVATGVAADGSIVIQDPNPLFGRSSLTDYLAGFNSAGAAWTAQLKGVVQFALRSPAATRFLVAALSQTAPLMQALTMGVQSANGACGLPWEAQDLVDSAGNSPARGALLSRIVACDGLDPAYQISVGAAQPFRAFVTDLASAGSTVDLSGSAPAAYKATRVQLNLVVAPQDISFAADGVVNAATFTAGIAPGGIISIFGSGLAGPGAPTGVDVDGTAASVTFSSAFQVNAVLPAGLTPGTHVLRVRSPFGAAQQNVDLAVVAPAIFLIGNPPAGAVENQDGSLNGPLNPLIPGQALVVYATGLGTLRSEGTLVVAATPVTVILNGQELAPSYAGVAPGFPGLYQVNVSIPTTTPPGLGLSLYLKQGGTVSNTVTAAVQ